MQEFLKKTVFAVTALFFMTSSARAFSMLPDFAPLAKSAGPAVVNISTEREIASPVMNMFNFPGMERFFEQFGIPFDTRQGPAPTRKSTALGSGFIISSDGYIVTNNHVVEGADKITVIMNGKESEPLPAKIIGTDSETDLALIRVESSKALPVLKFGDSDAMEVGEWVVAIGNPLGLNNTVTAGILSAKGRNIHAGPFDNFLQTDASINPGNSGGPLINMKGEVIGINTAISATGQGIGFAIPSSLASRIIEELREGKKISRGWMGVTIQDVSADMAKALGLKESSGALIGSVVEGEPAEKAGLKAGDVITRVGETPISNASELTRAIAILKPGTKTEVTFLRKGKEFTRSVTLGERAAHTDAGTVRNEKEPSSAIGMSVRPLMPDDLRALRLQKGVKGLLITSVTNGSPAADAGLRSGDVILSANLDPVTDTDDLAAILKREGKERGAVMFQINRRGNIFFVTVPLDGEKK